MEIARPGRASSPGRFSFRHAGDVEGGNL